MNTMDDIWLWLSVNKATLSMRRRERVWIARIELKNGDIIEGRGNLPKDALLDAIDLASD